MDTDSGQTPPHRPRPRNMRAKAALWTAVVSIAAIDDLASRLAIMSL